MKNMENVGRHPTFFDMFVTMPPPVFPLIFFRAPRFFGNYLPFVVPAAAARHRRTGAGVVGVGGMGPS